MFRRSSFPADAISLIRLSSIRLNGIIWEGSSLCVFPQALHSITRSRYVSSPSRVMSFLLHVPRTFRLPPHIGHGIVSAPVKIMTFSFRYIVPCLTLIIVFYALRRRRPTIDNRKLTFTAFALSRVYVRFRENGCNGAAFRNSLQHSERARNKGWPYFQA